MRKVYLRTALWVLPFILSFNAALFGQWQGSDLTVTSSVSAKKIIIHDPGNINGAKIKEDTVIVIDTIAHDGVGLMYKLIFKEILSVSFSIDFGYTLGGNNYLYEIEGSQIKDESNNVLSSQSIALDDSIRFIFKNDRVLFFHNETLVHEDLQSNYFGLVEFFLFFNEADEDELCFYVGEIVPELKKDVEFTVDRLYLDEGDMDDVCIQISAENNSDEPIEVDVSMTGSPSPHFDDLLSQTLIIPPGSSGPVCFSLQGDDPNLIVDSNHHYILRIDTVRGLDVCIGERNTLEIFIVDDTLLGKYLLTGDIVFIAFDSDIGNERDLIRVTNRVPLLPGMCFILTDAIPALDNGQFTWTSGGTSLISSQLITYVGDTILPIGSSICFELPNDGNSPLAENFTIKGEPTIDFNVESNGLNPSPFIDLSSSMADILFLLQGTWINSVNTTLDGNILSSISTGIEVGDIFSSTETCFRIRVDSSEVGAFDCEYAYSDFNGLEYTSYSDQSFWLLTENTSGNDIMDCTTDCKYSCDSAAYIDKVDSLLTIIYSDPQYEPLSIKWNLPGDSILIGEESVIIYEDGTYILTVEYDHCVSTDTLDSCIQYYDTSEVIHSYADPEDVMFREHSGQDPLKLNLKGSRFFSANNLSNFTFPLTHKESSLNLEDVNDAQVVADATLTTPLFKELSSPCGTSCTSLAAENIIWRLENWGITGFKTCISVGSSKNYLFAMTADDVMRFRLDGILIYDTYTINTENKFSTVIFEIYLDAGDHILEFVAKDNNQQTAWLYLDVYDNTFSELQSAQSRSDINFVFTTKDLLDNGLAAGDQVVEFDFTINCCDTIIIDSCTSLCVSHVEECPDTLICLSNPDFDFSPDPPPSSRLVSYIGDTTSWNIPKVHSSISEILVYPNPTRQTLKVGVQSLEKADILVDLLNAQGQSMTRTKYSLTQGANEFDLDVSDIPAGIYALRLFTNGKIFQEKVMVIH